METRFTVEPAFKGLLEAARLERFEEVMALRAAPGSVTRAVPGRFTVRVELPGKDGRGPGVVYLKRYRGLRRARAAAEEWRRLEEAAAAGIPCPARVAFGERRGALGARESFLMTAELPGATQADWWIAERPGRQSELVRAVAKLARRFHDAGFHHQDFYLCHFFVSEAAASGKGSPGLELFLIDLQRCGRRGVGRGGRRWLVKDLAQLHFSMKESGLGPEHWEDLLSGYGGLEPRLLRAVLRKSRRIARHVPRHP
jgi:hypothetical protein